MKKLDKSRSKDYGPLVIWANDLIELFSELASHDGFSFVVDDVKFDSVEEFITESRGRRPSVVKIKVNDPYMTIDLDLFSARLYVSSSQLLASGLFLRIDSILSRCERKPRFFFSTWWPIASVWTLPNIFYLPFLKSFEYLQILASVLTLAWLLVAGYINLRKHSSVIPAHQEDMPSFFKRNSDGIVIAVISALLGAVGGAAATKVSDHIWPSSSNAPVLKDASPQSTPRSLP